MSTTNRIAIDSVKFRNNPLFQGLSDEIIKQLVDMLPPPQSYAADQTIISEGEEAHELFIILSGSIEVLKHEPNSAIQHQLSVLDAGQTFGEVLLLAPVKRLASIHTLEETEVVAVPFSLLNELSNGEDSMLGTIKLNLAEIQIQRLSQANETTAKSLTVSIEEAKKRAALAGFIGKLLLSCCSYIFAMGIYNALGLSNSTYLTLPIALLWVGLILHMVCTNGYPMTTYGFTWKNGYKYAWQAINLTLIIIVALILIKWLLLSSIPAYQHLPLFDLSESYAMSTAKLQLMIVLYIFIIAPLEELVRGGAQGSLQLLLTGEHTKIRANILCNIVFSAVHVHMSLGVALLVFPVGMLWGWIFSQQNSVVGPIICHILLGGVAFFIIGIPL